MDASIATFPFQALGKSKALGETEGFAQIVFEKESYDTLPNVVDLRRKDWTICR